MFSKSVIIIVISENSLYSPLLFNNLLMGILGEASYLKNNMDVSKDVVAGLEKIEMASSRSAELAQRLVRLGKPAPRKAELIQPRDIVEEITNNLANLYKEVN